MLAGKAGLSSPAGCDGRRLLGHQLKGAGTSPLARRVSPVLKRHIAKKCSPEGVAGPPGKGDGAGSVPKALRVVDPDSSASDGSNIEVMEVDEVFTTPEDPKVHTPSPPPGPAALILQYTHWGMSLGALYVANKTLASAAASAGVKFPSALIGMFIIIALLGVVEAIFSETGVNRVMDAFAPALNWIQRWLPLFYVPSLVIIPLALKGIAGADLAKILGIIAVGMPASLLVTALVAVTIRQATNTEMEPQPPPKLLPPFTRNHYIAWGSIGLAALLAAVIDPTQYGAAAGLPFLLAATVGGYLLGVALPKGVSSVVHPLITCAAVANIGAATLGFVNGAGYEGALKSYLTKGAGPLGAGDFLMSFLGVVILSFGFKIYGQRRLMVRHAPEIFGSTILSAAFSMFSTVTVARAINLAPELSLALVPRSVTVALALPISAQLGAPAAITAAGVVLTGLLGANFAQILLNKFNFTDPIARGLATAGSAHGLGTAALAGKEPEALPFCALAYALIGVISTVLASIPLVSSTIIAIAGAP